MIKVVNNKRPNLIAANLTLLRVVDVLVNMFVTAKVVLEMCACRTIRRHRVCGESATKYATIRKSVERQAKLLHF